jgi:hypothetical protein
VYVFEGEAKCARAQEAVDVKNAELNSTAVSKLQAFIDEVEANGAISLRRPATECMAI